MKIDWQLNPPCNGKVYSQSALLEAGEYRIRIIISKVVVGGTDTYECHLSSYRLSKEAALALAHKLAETVGRMI